MTLKVNVSEKAIKEARFIEKLVEEFRIYMKEKMNENN